jgi:hypothetical protein
MIGELGLLPKIIFWNGKPHIGSKKISLVRWHLILSLMVIAKAPSYGPSYSVSSSNGLTVRL